MITSAEAEVIWSVVGKLGVIIGVVVALIKGIEYLWSLAPTSKLEKRVKECEEHDKQDFEHLKAIDSRINVLEEKLKISENKIKHIDEGVMKLGKSQISLLRHFVSGNGKDEMSEEAEALTEYFIERKMV